MHSLTTLCTRLYFDEIMSTMNEIWMLPQPTKYLLICRNNGPLFKTTVNIPL